MKTIEEYAPKARIDLYNRVSGAVEREQVCGRKWMELVYGTRWGRRLAGCLLIRRPLSRLYGAWQDSPMSRRRIAPFAAQYGIDLSEVEVPRGGFRSFNDFFTRRLKPGARPVDPDPACLVAPADSRMQVWPLDSATPVMVKGAGVTLPQLLKTEKLDASFEGGLCLSFRLAPVDYHRFGYVDEGVQDPVRVVPGPLHSVNPLALRHKPDILGTNRRHWCLVHSVHFGTMIVVEVGALMVGSITQHQPRGGPCRRGAEKGYFQFGGSTVLVLMQPGRAVIDADVSAWSRKGIETLVRYGERIGLRAGYDNTSPRRRN